jgi:hypothetical protein
LRLLCRLRAWAGDAAACIASASADALRDAAADEHGADALALRACGHCCRCRLPPITVRCYSKPAAPTLPLARTADGGRANKRAFAPRRGFWAVRSSNRLSAFCSLPLLFTILNWWAGCAAGPSRREQDLSSDDHYQQSVRSALTFSPLPSHLKQTLTLPADERMVRAVRCGVFAADWAVLLPFPLPCGRTLWFGTCGARCRVCGANCVKRGLKTRLGSRSHGFDAWAGRRQEDVGAGGTAVTLKAFARGRALRWTRDSCATPVSIIPGDTIAALFSWVLCCYVMRFVAYAFLSRTPDISPIPLFVAVNAAWRRRTCVHASSASLPTIPC